MGLDKYGLLKTGVPQEDINENGVFDKDRWED